MRADRKCAVPARRPRAKQGQSAETSSRNTRFESVFTLGGVSGGVMGGSAPRERSRAADQSQNWAEVRVETFRIQTPKSDAPSPSTSALRNPAEKLSSPAVPLKLAAPMNLKA